MVISEHTPRTERFLFYTCPYSVRDAASCALAGLLSACQHEVPAGYLQHLQHITFTSSSPVAADAPLFPCPMKEQEATAAVRALEGLAAAAIADLCYGAQPRRITVDVSKVGCFLMSAYMTTIDGMDKGNPGVKDRIPSQ